MTILVPSWSRVDFFLRNRYIINNVYIFSVCDVLPDVKWLKTWQTFIWAKKKEKCLTSWIPGKTGPGSESLVMVVYMYLIWEKIFWKMKANCDTHFSKESIYDLHLTLISACTCMFSTNIPLTKFGPGFWSRIPAVGPGFYFFPRFNVFN